MSITLPHRSLIAWMLFCVILLNGLVCSFGHGQMLEAFFSPVTMQDCAQHRTTGDDASVSKMMGHSKTTRSDYGECSFAGTLALAIVFFAALTWLLGLPNGGLRAPERVRKKPLRFLFVSLNPQAP